MERRDILPFHKMGGYKWQISGLAYTLKDTPPPSDELIGRVLDIFRGHGLRAV